MAVKALHLKYRPQTFDDIIGNEATVTAIRSILERKNSDDRQHSFLLSGPKGCGKTTIARIIKSTLNCLDKEFFEYNTANTRGIDSIRDIASHIRYKPVGGVRIYLLDEAHKLTNDAQNALLKLLEDTPSHAYFILCTTDPQKILGTVRDRCGHFVVSPLDVIKMKSLIDKVLKTEGAEFPKELIDKIIQRSDGSPRRALVLLDSIIDNPGTIDQLMKAVDNTAVDEETDAVVKICQTLLRTDMNAEKKWKEITPHLKKINKSDAEESRVAIMGYLSKVLWNAGTNDRVAKLMMNFQNPYFSTGTPQLILDCYMACKI